MISYDIYNQSPDVFSSVLPRVFLCPENTRILAVGAMYLH